jgi:transcriptional regulator with XRE-family HTH domain
MSVPKAIGERIRRRRMSMGLIQKTLAERTHMPQAHISHFERGQFETINPEKLIALASALQTTTDFLLGLSEDAGPLVELEPAGVA